MTQVKTKFQFATAAAAALTIIFCGTMAVAQARARATPAPAPKAAPAASTAPFDPMAGLVTETVTLSNELKQLTPEEIQTWWNSPESMKYRNGNWDYPNAATAARRGLGCFALYSKASGDPTNPESLHIGMVGILGPNEDYDGAGLVFWTDRFPDQVVPNKKVLVTLKQTGDPDVTINALYFKRKTARDFDKVFFAVPTIEAAIGGMTDNLGFEVIFEGQTVAKIDWTNGLQAKRKIQDCRAGRS